MDQLFKDMFRIKMMLSVGLFLAVALVNTQGLSIQGEEGVAINGDEVEQELDVSRVFLFYISTKMVISDILILGHPGAGGHAGYGGQQQGEEGRPRDHQL